jgi:transcriptional regulator with XRE-family HTH domain
MGEFGAKLADILKERGWNQKTAAAKLGIPQGSLSRYISGATEPSISVVEKITAALEVPIGRLTGEPVRAMREAGGNYMGREDLPALDALRRLRRRYRSRAGDRRQIELALEMVFGDDFKAIKKWLETE